MYFEQFEIYIQKELCSPDDIEPYINYHVKLFNGQVPHSQGYHEALFTYIVLYEFALAQKFLSRFKQAPAIPKAVSAAGKRRETLAGGERGQHNVLYVALTFIERDRAETCAADPRSEQRHAQLVENRRKIRHRNQRTHIRHAKLGRRPIVKTARFVCPFRRDGYPPLPREYSFGRELAAALPFGDMKSGAGIIAPHTRRFSESSIGRAVGDAQPDGPPALDRTIDIGTQGLRPPRPFLFPRCANHVIVRPQRLAMTRCP